METVVFWAFKQKTTTKEAPLTRHTGIKIRFSHMINILDTTELCLEHLEQGFTNKLCSSQVLFSGAAFDVEITIVKTMKWVKI